MLTTTQIPLREDYRAELKSLEDDRLSKADCQRRSAIQAGGRFLVMTLVIFGIITIIAAFFGEAVALWTERPILPLILLGMFAFTLWQGWREGAELHETQAELLKEVSTISASTRARQLTLSLDAQSFAIDHEHGRIFVTSNAEGGTTFFDVPTIADDPREAMAKTDTPASHWRWMDIPGTGFLRDVEKDGAPQPLRIYHVDTLEDIDAVLRLLDAEDGMEALNTLPVDPQTIEAQIRSALEPTGR